MSEPSATPPVSEHARLVLSTTRKLGWFRSIPCYLVFQPKELILVHLDKAKTKEAIAEFRAEQKAEGKGFMATTFAMIGFWRNYGHRYYQSSRDDLLQLNPANIALPYTTIQRLVFRTARSYGAADHNDATPKPGKLILQTNAEKLKFSHEYYDSNKKIKGILQDLAGTALKYRAPIFHKTLSINLGGSPDGID
ncbi:MAG: hypothetical protein LAT55_06675 [Opitutales bacterium]|nr:hypothetical protein [Opitutales bacterium]